MDNLHKGRKIGKTTGDEYILRLISETTDTNAEAHPQSAPYDQASLRTGTGKAQRGLTLDTRITTRMAATTRVLRIAPGSAFSER
ncbi:unnamed protein product [Haemonchus placei]|uniref:Transposase n=1 Tax=Haemonchus placei TaxID=6290 RepID=A0A0N4WA25_HAEPC|nr:unnamed protein product [Haemonchus placei]